MAEWEAHCLLPTSTEGIEQTLLTHSGLHDALEAAVESNLELSSPQNRDGWFSVLN